MEFFDEDVKENVFMKVVVIYFNCENEVKEI